MPCVTLQAEPIQLKQLSVQPVQGIVTRENQPSRPVLSHPIPSPWDGCLNPRRASKARADEQFIIGPQPSAKAKESLPAERLCGFAP